MEDLISPTSPEVLFNALPLVRRGLALVIAVLRNSEVVKRSGAIPFVTYFTDSDVALKEVKTQSLAFADSISPPTLYVLGDDAGAGAKSMDGSISFIQKLTTMGSSFILRWINYQDFTKKYGFILKSEVGMQSPKIWYPSEIINDFIFVGSKTQAKQTDQLCTLGIKYVISCVKTIFNQEQLNKFVCVDANLADLSRGNDVIFSMLDKARDLKEKVLIFDTKGSLHSLAVVVEYLMAREAMKLENAMKIVDRRRSSMDFSTSLREQLQAFEEDLKKNPFYYSSQAVAQRNSSDTMPKENTKSSTLLQTENLSPRFEITDAHKQDKGLGLLSPTHLSPTHLIPPKREPLDINGVEDRNRQFKTSRSPVRNSNRTMGFDTKLEYRAKGFNNNVILTDPNGKMFDLAKPKPMEVVIEGDRIEPKIDIKNRLSWITIELIPRFLHVSILADSSEKENESLKENFSPDMLLLEECEVLKKTEWSRKGIDSAIMMKAVTITHQSTRVPHDLQMNSLNHFDFEVDTPEGFAESAGILYKLLEKLYLHNSRRFVCLLDEECKVPELVLVGLDKALVLSAASAFLMHHQLRSLSEVLLAVNAKLGSEPAIELSSEWGRYLHCLCIYETLLFDYPRSRAETVTDLKDIQQRRYVTLGPRQFFNFMQISIPKRGEKHITEILLWDTRPSTKYLQGHIKSGKVEAANLPVIPGKEMPNPDEMHKRLKDIRARLSWKSWRLRDLVVYGSKPLGTGVTDGFDTNNYSTNDVKESLKHLAAYLATQMKLHGMCWLLSDYLAFSTKYPYLITEPMKGKTTAASTGFRIQCRTMLGYPLEILDGFLFFSDLSGEQVSDEFKKRLKEMGIQYLIAINADIEVEDVHCTNAKIDGDLLSNFEQHVTVFHSLEHLRNNAYENGESASDTTSSSQFKRQKVLICSAPSQISSNISPRSSARASYADTLVLAYVMILQNLTLGKLRQMTQDYHLNLAPDWKALRQFSRKRKHVLSQSHVKTIGCQMKSTFDDERLPESNKRIGNIRPFNEKEVGVTSAVGVDHKSNKLNICAKSITVHNLVNLLSSKIKFLVLDTRSLVLYSQKHIPRSICVPLDPNLPQIPIEDLQSAIRMPANSRKEQDYIDKIRAAISAFGAYHIVLVADSNVSTEKVTNALLREFHSLNRKVNISHLEGGFKAFLTAYPGLIITEDKKSCISETYFDVPLSIPTVVVPARLFLGSLEDSKNVEIMRSLRIKRVVLVTKYKGVYTFYPDEFDYMRMEPLPVSFENSANLVWNFVNAADYDRNATILVGHSVDSATATYAIAYLIQTEKLSMVEASQQIQTARPTLALSARAATQACNFENHVFSGNNKRGNSQDSNEFYDFDKCLRREPKEPDIRMARKLTNTVVGKKVRYENNLSDHKPSKIRFHENNESTHYRMRIQRIEAELLSTEKEKDKITLENRRLKLQLKQATETVEVYRKLNQKEAEKDTVFEASPLNSGEFSDELSQGSGTSLSEEETLTTTNESLENNDTKEKEDQIRKEIEMEIRQKQEGDIRKQIEGEIRKQSKEKMIKEIEEEIRQTKEKEIRKQIEEEVRSEIEEKAKMEVEVRMRKEEDIRKQIEVEFNRKIEAKMNQEIEARIRNNKESMRKEVELRIRQAVINEVRRENEINIKEYHEHMSDLKVLNKRFDELKFPLRSRLIHCQDEENIIHSINTAVVSAKMSVKASNRTNGLIIILMVVIGLYLMVLFDSNTVDDYTVFT